jgi:hypothetical protein
MATNNPRPVSYIGAKLPCPRSTENNVDWCSGDLSLGLESGFGERVSGSVVDVGGSGLGPRVYGYSRQCVISFLPAILYRHTTQYTQYITTRYLGITKYSDIIACLFDPS